MCTIINVEKLSRLFTDQEILEIVKAFNTWPSSNLELKILRINISGAHKRIEALITENFNENDHYFDRSTLELKVVEIFKPFLANKFINVEVQPYRSNVVEIVNPSWIEDRMSKKSLRIKDLAFDTGIDKTNLSGWINGSRAMSQPVKAMFYYYLTRPTERKEIIVDFMNCLNKAKVGTVIPVPTFHLSEIDIRHYLIKKAIELNCQVSIGDFSKAVAEIKFYQKEFHTLDC